MIVGDINRLQAAGLSTVFCQAIDQALSAGLAQLAPGSYPLQGEKMFVNVMQFETQRAEQNVPSCTATILISRSCWREKSTFITDWREAPGPAMRGTRRRIISSVTASGMNSA